MKNVSLAEAMSHSPEGFALLDWSGKILSWNAALENITGVSPKAAIGNNIQEILAPINGRKQNAAVWCKQALDALIAGKDHLRTEYDILRTDGVSLPIEIYCHSFSRESESGANSKNTGTFLCIFVRDTTERKRREDAMETAMQIIRHDLKDRLNSIIGFSSAEMVDDYSLEDCRSYLELINRESSKMNEMINTALLLGKMEQGGFILTKEPVNFFSFLEDIKKEFFSLRRSEQTILKIGLDHKDMFVEGNLEIRIEQTLFHSALAQLLKNAVEAVEAKPAQIRSSTGNKISLLVSCQEKKIVFKVQNEGEIPEKIREHLFQKYATFGKQYGTGLGLYSVKLITQAHGGDVSMTTGEGKTTFAITIPL